MKDELRKQEQLQLCMLAARHLQAATKFIKQLEAMVRSHRNMTSPS